MKRITNSYIKHFVYAPGVKWTEGFSNKFLGSYDTDGSIMATFFNSEGRPSMLNAKAKRIGPFVYIEGTATGYKKYPEGCPYHLIGFQLMKTYRLILLSPHGFVYVRLQEETSK